MSAQLFQSMVANMLIVVWLYIYCFFGDNITRKCGDVSEIAFDLNFFMYPVALQRYLILIMAVAQKPFYITGLQITRCSLESFKKVFSVCDN